MIARISGDGQYRLDDSLRERLNELDNACVEHVGAGDEETFRERYDELLTLIRGEGERLPDDELVGSDVVFPPSDITLEEASREFTGEGLIPD